MPKHEHITISMPHPREKLKEKKRSLKEQYKLAAKEESRNQEFKLWEEATLGDGLAETNDW